MESKKPLYPTGVIHGRFQVLHNDHLKYLLAGKALCCHLVIGITNPDPWLVKKEQVDPHRSDPLANPLTYYERYLLVKEVLDAEGVPSTAFSIVPLPINLPERYQYYVPMEGVFFVTIYDGWGERKLYYFKSLGLQTHIMRHVSAQEKGLSAGDIRRAMLKGEPWAHWVPAAAASRLRHWKIAERLRSLEKDGTD
jgi:nicotinamide mononucleotide adenylyltransferase